MQSLAVNRVVAARATGLVARTAMPALTRLAHTVIVGAGIGGLPMAYDLKTALGPSHKVTVVDPRPAMQFTPSNPWVAVGWRTKDEISLPMDQTKLKSKGVEFVQAAADKIDPEGKTVVTSDGRTLNYDYLVIATGPKLAFEEIPGLGPAGFTSSICTTDHALESWKHYQEFVKNPGPIVVGAAPGASCFGPAYEFAMILDSDLRKRGIRDRVPMTFVTSEPYIGHMGLGGVGDSKGLLESEFRQRHIKWLVCATRSGRGCLPSSKYLSFALLHYLGLQTPRLPKSNKARWTSSNVTKRAPRKPTTPCLSDTP